MVWIQIRTNKPSDTLDVLLIGSLNKFTKKSQLAWKQLKNLVFQISRVKKKMHLEEENVFHLLATIVSKYLGFVKHLGLKCYVIL